jgi:hypothetical protein
MPRAQHEHGQLLQCSWGSHYELITRVEELDAGRCTWHGWAGQNDLHIAVTIKSFDASNQLVVVAAVD